MKTCIRVFRVQQSRAWESNRGPRGIEFVFSLSSSQHSAGSSTTTGAIATAEQYTERLADAYKLAALEFVALCQFKSRHFWVA